MWWARDSHMHGASFWTSDDEMFTYVGVPWPYMATRQVKQSIALADDVAGVHLCHLCFLIWHVMVWEIDLTRHTSFNPLISLAANREAIHHLPSAVCNSILIRDLTCSNDSKWKYFERFVIITNQIYAGYRNIRPNTQRESGRRNVEINLRKSNKP